MEESNAATAVVARPKTIVIERRWAIVGGGAIAALIIGLGVALAIAAGDDGPDGPLGFQFSADEGYGPRFPQGGDGQFPQGAPPIPQAPEGTYPPGGGTYPAPPQGVPVPPGGQGAPNSQGGNGSGGSSNR
jgi:hypothetical protein